MELLRRRSIGAAAEGWATRLLAGLGQEPSGAVKDAAAGGVPPALAEAARGLLEEELEPLNVLAEAAQHKAKGLRAQSWRDSVSQALSGGASAAHRYVRGKPT